MSIVTGGFLAQRVPVPSSTAAALIIAGGEPPRRGSPLRTSPSLLSHSRPAAARLLAATACAWPRGGGAGSMASEAGSGLSRGAGKMAGWGAAAATSCRRAASSSSIFCGSAAVASGGCSPWRGTTACCVAPRGGAWRPVPRLPAEEADGRWCGCLPRRATAVVAVKRTGGRSGSTPPGSGSPRREVGDGGGLAQALIFRWAMVAVPCPTLSSRTMAGVAARSRCCLGRGIVVADARGGWSSGCIGSRAKVLLGLRPLPATMVPWCIILLLEGVAVRTSTSKDSSR
ncbi:hypothetical protein GQ55_9G235900 [Panicum hallii var. hallii]|uniref:Uncharacterized protein n=1 Tax=Panicum hallii var. hallii TaxID=1504633 RepID=A0A2T7C6F3_9POAL|nr:hypothetical protein GQ55_9G235900 [Panicum hallii var. hallii]